MFEKKYYSAHHDFKTGFLCKFTLFLGAVLIIIYLLTKLIAIVGNKDISIIEAIYEFSQSNAAGAALAFGVILIAVGIMLYFLHCQFVKLAKIADEVEKEELEDAK